MPDAQPQAPAPVQLEQAPSIRDVATGFLEEIDTNSDPDQIRVDEPQETPPDGEALEQPQGEAEPPPPEQPVIEYELDDGEKLQVPEKLKPHLMRDKDYRQKTMALAEQRKSFEQLTQSAQQLATQAQQLAPYHAQLVALDNRLNQLDHALRSGQLDNDPLEFNKVQGELAIGLRNRDALANGIGQQMNHITAQQNQLRVQQLAIDAPKLFEEVPELAKTEVRSEVAKYVRDQGLPQEAIDYLNYSAAGAKLAWKAQQFDAMVKAQAVTKAKLNEKVKTLPAANQTSRGNSGLPTDKLQQQWKKDGGGIDSPAFKALLRAKTKGN